MFSAMASSSISAKRRVARDTSAERRAATAGVAGAIGASPVVSTNVSETKRPVACSRAFQKRVPAAEP